jgi:COP9 signalosome complex subunit 1
MGQNEYDRAARGFLNVSPPQPTSSSLSSSHGRENASTGATHYIPPADIGLYGILCGMATFSRQQFKRLVIDNANIRPYLEHTPFLKDLIQLYYNSRFLPALQSLEDNMTRLRLDIHLAAHVHDLMAKIKDKMVEQYFEPFRSVKIEKMASAFGWNVTALEKTLVRLIEGGSMKARIDKQAQVSRAIDPWHISPLD